MTSNGARPDTITSRPDDSAEGCATPDPAAADRPGSAPAESPPASRLAPPAGTAPRGEPWRWARLLPTSDTWARLLPTSGPRRLALLAAVVVVVTTGLGALASLFLPAQYAGRAELIYPISVEQPTGFLREDRELTTQLLLIGSRAVLEPVARESGLDVVELQERVSVEIVDSSEIIQVEVRAATRDESVALVGAVVDQYLALAAEQRTDPARDYLAAEIQRTRESIADAPEDGNLVARESALVAQLDTLTTLELSRPAPTLLVTPYSPTDPVGVRATTTTAAGFLLGVLAAAALVLASLRHGTQPRTGSPDDEPGQR